MLRHDTWRGPVLLVLDDSWRFHVMFQGASLGSDATAAQAAEGEVLGATFRPPDGTVLGAWGISPRPMDWSWVTTP